MINKERIISLFNKYQELNGICKDISLFEGCDEDYRIDMDIIDIGEKTITLDYFDGKEMNYLTYRYVGLGLLEISVNFPEDIPSLFDQIQKVFIYVEKFFRLLSVNIEDFFKMDILVNGEDSYTLHSNEYIDETTMDDNENYIRVDNIKENRNEFSSSRFTKNTISESDILRITNKVIKNL